MLKSKFIWRENSIIVGYFFFPSWVSISRIFFSILQDKDGDPYCQCAGSFTGKRCEEKSEFAYIAGGVAGSVIFLILLVLLIWMICVRANRTRKTPEKILGAAADQNGSQVSFFKQYNWISRKKYLIF